MNINTWLSKNAKSLKGKTVAMTGSTGGLGSPIALYLAALGARLLLLDRNSEKARALKTQILEKYPQTEITLIKTDLEDERSVASACDELEKHDIDFFLHNAGAYSIPRKICKTGYLNIYEINFLSPYYMINRLLPSLRARGGKVVVVGSIAHNYSRSDKNNIDFKDIKADSKVYGNAKRYLQFALYELFKNEDKVSLSVTHPGITFTNITAHYPKWLFRIIKHPMKIIFMPPKIAALSIIKGFFCETKEREWIGPWLFSVWGRPSKSALSTCSISEQQEIFSSAQKALGKFEEIINANRK